MQFAVLASTVFAAIGLVKAIDYRLLYAIPAGDTMAQFTTDFQNTCSTWAPAEGAGLTFRFAFIRPGDYRGENTDTEALIYCTWEDGATVTAFTEDVAESLEATWLP
ncbi:hypothetical protein MSAN_02124200 [Mycena sanguinolenta]|uniref:Uncharacterized protein n=1 Tax=Mycena sanguinolenta TaxID=230812 RepID=A0A8H7CLN3_9AGAR|nr:hypothetical protein MSAN_02124200 [Mycena sanguinolenta]